MIQSNYGVHGQIKRSLCPKMVFPPPKKTCLIGYDLETLPLDGQRVLLVLTFGEWAGAKKRKSLKEIKTQMGRGKDIVVIRFLMNLHTCFSCLAQPRALSLRLCSCNRFLRDILMTCHVFL